MNQKITIQYFPRDLDRDVVRAALLDALKDAGFVLSSGAGNPSLSSVPTNTVWYGTNVPDESIRIVALALMRAGVKLREIKPISNPSSESKSRLIQIGAAARVQQNQAYTVDQVKGMAVPR